MGQKPGGLGRVSACVVGERGVKESRSWLNAKIRFERFSPITYTRLLHTSCFVAYFYNNADVSVLLKCYILL